MSIREISPFSVEIHARIEDQGDLSAWRVCFDGTNCQENAAPINELYYLWNTFGWSDGDHIITVEYREISDGGNWANADVVTFAHYLSPIRNGLANCGSGDGVELTSGSDCIRLTESRLSLHEIGWSDRYQMSIEVIGDSFALAFDSSNFIGPPKIVKSGQTIAVGSNVSSVEIRDNTDPPPALFDEPTEADAYTTHLWHFDENTGNTVYDSVGSMNGTLTGSANRVLSDVSDNDFGYAIHSSGQAQAGSGLNFGAVNFGSAFTFETWVKFDSLVVDQRIAGQVSGGGNTGSNKWLLSAVNDRIRTWACHSYGCHEGYSYTILSPDQWFYVMFSYDGANTAKLYVNNELQTTINMDFPMASGATTFQVGHAEGIYGCECTLEDTRVSNVARAPIYYALDTSIGDPTTNEVTAFVDWAGARYDWHVVNWGDGSDYGMQGYSDQRVPTHVYANPGTYTVTFTAMGKDNLPYTATDTVYIDSYACDTAVTDPGLILYDYKYCASVSGSDSLQLFNPGLYNLDDFDFADKVQSVHFPANTSVMFYDGPDATGQSYCRSWDMWDMAGDYWPDSTSMNNSVESIEIFVGAGCVPPPVATVEANIVDPHGLAQVNVTWSGTNPGGWQILRFGTGDLTGWQGSSGTQSPQYWYLSPGTYTVEFEVENAPPNWMHYVVTDTVTIGGPWACGGAVQQTGVTFYRFSDCSYRDSSDYEQFSTAGVYNLSTMDNQASSIHIPSGMSVMLYEGANQTGESKCVAWDPWNLASDTWPSNANMDNTISSVKIYNNSTCTD